MTEVVSGLAPELAGAKKGQGLVPEASAGERFTSYDVDAFEVPSGREENWRFTPSRRLRGLHDGTASFDGTAVIEVDGLAREVVGRDDKRLGAGGVPADRVAAAAWSAFREATVVELRGTPEPVTISVAGPGEGATAASHLQIRTAPQAEATVVLTYSGSGTLADNVEIVLGDASRLTLVVTDEWADGVNEGAVHVGAQHFSIGRDATLRATSVALGGDLVRVSQTVQYQGPGGDAELLGLGFADAGQHLEQRLLVDHAVPNCTSNVHYKNALQGEGAHTVWIGDVLIRAAAEGTQTFELNRNLVLTEKARADSVPNLEIETGEIAGAGHASATGRFDDEQLFYLQSRGIPEDVARRLVVRGFFGEILSKITIPELRERLESAIEAELSTAAL
jgi:Fe-S cluster assembly protein SufD